MFGRLISHYTEMRFTCVLEIFEENIIYIPLWLFKFPGQ